MDVVKAPIFQLRSSINSRLISKEPFQIVALTASSVLLVSWLYNYIFEEDESVLQRWKKCFFRLARKVPFVKKKIDSELKSIEDNFYNDISKQTKGLKYLTELPEEGLTKDQILEIVNEDLSLGHYDWKNGLVSGTIYYDNPELKLLVTEVYGKTSYTNPLHPDVFPGLCKMEAEVLRMAANLFHGDEKTGGSMTSGGTESILMACKTWRDYGRDVKGIKKPEIVLPATIHSAFDKAAQYFGLRVKSIPVIPNTCQVDINAMKKAISRNTVMLAGSAPNFPYGTMDDIAAISELGVKYDIPVHVDSCLGGFLTIFMEQAGYPIPVCDFRLPGVKSISADTHKYGYAPKGSSLVLYRDRKYRHYQYTVTTDWPGGVYGSPTVSGSRAGGNVAVCWAAMLNFGLKGYVEATREVIHTSKYIETGLRRIKGIFIFGQPVTSVIAIGSAEFEIYRLATALQELGWNLSILQFPSGIHLTITHLHTQAGVADKFLNDVKNSINVIQQSPQDPVEGRMALYGVAQTLPDRSLVADFTHLFLDSLYYTPNKQ